MLTGVVGAGEMSGPVDTGRLFRPPNALRIAKSRSKPPIPSTIRAINLRGSLVRSVSRSEFRIVVSASDSPTIGELLGDGLTEGRGEDLNVPVDVAEPEVVAS